MRRRYIAPLILGLNFLTAPAAHAQITVPMYKTSATGEQTTIGQVTLSDTEYGLLIEPQLTQLLPGLHGFHLHQHPNCDDHGMAAGGHFDPQQTGKHLGPYNAQGHLGDLPPLYTTCEGTANVPTLAPRLHEADVKGLALMIHAGGDNFSDTPEPLGGGGERIACGVIGDQK
ncbi:MAG: superoxide dismutase [Legionellales bacterium]|nr:superoxide dismutase [Legionellales bacterium]